MGSSQKRKMIRFFLCVFDTLKNNTSKGKGKAKYKELGGGKKEKRKKNRGCALSFYIGYFGNSFCPKISA